jgi:hypothetical protein
MNHDHEIIGLVAAAKGDSLAADELVRKYLPLRIGTIPRMTTTRTMTTMTRTTTEPGIVRLFGGKLGHACGKVCGQCG